MLSQLPIPKDPNLLVGVETADDAAVYRLRKDLAIVQTVDYFTPVVDDPYHFGAITAANSLSDIYAMGAKPLFALNIVGFPSRSLPLEVLTEILKGGSDKAQEAGVPIVGGHTIDDPEPKYGMAVTGIVHPKKVVTNASAKVGDALVLTKPLGIGIITTAIKREKASPRAIKKAIAVMSTLNKEASEAMLEVGVHACTDITGFGLLGHLHEMTTGSRVGARIYLSKVPVLPEAWPLVKKGVAPGGTYNNRRFLEGAVTWEPGVSEEEQLVLCDAQTSGGLLIAVSRRKEKALVSALKRAKALVIARIGEIVKDEEGKIEVVP